MANELPKEEFSNDVVTPGNSLSRERAKPSRAGDPNDQQEITQGTGPDAIIGHSVETGEPLTKREVFPEGSSMLEVDKASQKNERGPELVGTPVKANTEDSEAMAEEAGNTYLYEREDPEEAGTGGWHDDQTTNYNPPLKDRTDGQ